MDLINVRRSGRRKRRIVLAVWLAGLCGAAWAGQGAPAAPAFAPAYAPGPAARARTGPTLPVGKCINASNMLEAPREGAWGPPLADEDFAILKAAGFATVRIPVAWSSHAAHNPPYAIDPAFLRRVHEVVRLATDAGLNVILDMHGEDALMADPAAEADRFVGLWSQVAARFEDAPPSVWFDLLDEPHGALTATNLPAVLEPALAAVRATNPTRAVLIGGGDWGSLDGLLRLEAPDDPNVVPTFHYYEPFAFTHQGATWVEDPPPIGRSFGSAADKAQLDRNLERVRAYMQRTGRVPVMGEFGAQDDPRVPLAQRLLYYRTISAAFASIGVQGCAWGYRAGFHLREGRQWLPGALDALATTQP
jgi:endoglucanase